MGPGLLWRTVCPVLLYLTLHALLRQLLAVRLPFPGEVASVVFAPWLVWLYADHHRPRAHRARGALLAALASGCGAAVCCCTHSGAAVVWGSCLAGPVNEEIVYRGCACSALAQGYGRRAALLLSALLFAVGHGAVSLLPGAFLAGLLFGALYEYTGRLRYPIALHIAWNVLVQLPGR